MKKAESLKKEIEEQKEGNEEKVKKFKREIDDLTFEKGSLER